MFFVVKNIILLILKALLKGKFSYWRKSSKKVVSGKSRGITPEQKIKLNSAFYVFDLVYQFQMICIREI